MVNSLNSLRLPVGGYSPVRERNRGRLSKVLDVNAITVPSPNPVHDVITGSFVVGRDGKDGKIDISRSVGDMGIPNTNIKLHKTNTTGGLLTF